MRLGAFLQITRNPNKGDKHDMIGYFRMRMYTFSVI